ncbi:dTMP kinase [bacterium]|nr:dTMP kinase [bacterium]
MKSKSRSRASGRFITFEGTEGAGKSTLMAALRAELNRHGIEVITTREPGGVPVAEKIRAVILENKMSSWTELFLYEAARAEHLQSIILPALKRGAWVLCDRFTDSSLAYQGHARGLPWKKVEALNQLATDGREPDLVVWLDIDPEKGLRAAKDPNRFEAEGVAFQARVRAGFRKAMKRRPRYWLKLKAHSKAVDEMAASLASTLLKKFAR